MGWKRGTISGWRKPYATVTHMGNALFGLPTAGLQVWLYAFNLPSPLPLFLALKVDTIHIPTQCYETSSSHPCQYHSHVVVKH